MQKTKMKQHYTTVYAQVFSPCGKFVAAANNFGSIAVFNVSKLLNCDSLLEEHEVDLRLPVYSFKAHDGPIYALEATEDFLISAGTGDILGWSWKDLLNKSAKVIWAVSIPEGTSIGKSETNALLLNKTDDLLNLYAGCGDNKVYSFDLVAQKLKGKFTGHVDYVHCLGKTNSSNNDGKNEVWSGGEDGLVLAWDTRRGGEPVRRFEPAKNELCSRPSFGKWIGCVAIDGNDEWMICGGGPDLSMWHLRSMSCTQTFPTVDCCAMSAAIHEDIILSGGTEAAVYCWSFAGDEESKIPTSALAVYSLVTRDTPEHKILSVSGSSSNIDICSNFKYKDFSLTFV